MSRLLGATRAICQAVAAAGAISLESIGPDDDLVVDLGLKTLEIVGLGLILEEIFSIAVPDNLFASALYRTPAAIAEWAIRQSDHQAWLESQRASWRA